MYLQKVGTGTGTYLIRKTNEKKKTFFVVILEVTDKKKQNFEPDPESDPEPLIMCTGYGSKHPDPYQCHGSRTVAICRVKYVGTVLTPSCPL